ncbi:MAG: HAD family hydrolase, partial [Campylobacterales bacterium]
DILVAGDSGNDEDMLSGGSLAIVVGNYSKELKKLRGRVNVYFANTNYAAGILEGINYYDF